jgi:hypothetical protein
MLGRVMFGLARLGDVVLGRVMLVRVMEDWAGLG